MFVVRELSEHAGVRVDPCAGGDIEGATAVDDGHLVDISLPIFLCS
jgi:hypothetical protein